MRYLIATIAAAAVAAGAANATYSPSLHLVRTSPLVIHGTAFKPRQVVKATTPSGNVIVRTSIYGQFTVTLPGVADRCSSGVSILAATPYGRTLATLHLPQPMCAPMRNDGAPTSSARAGGSTA